MSRALSAGSAAVDEAVTSTWRSAESATCSAIGSVDRTTRTRSVEKCLEPTEDARPRVGCGSGRELRWQSLGKRGRYLSTVPLAASSAPRGPKRRQVVRTYFSALSGAVGFPLTLAAGAQTACTLNQASPAVALWMKTLHPHPLAVCSGRLSFTNWSPV